MSMVSYRDSLERLARSRPVFHSEADFQHALAWEIHQQLPQAAIHLEQPVRTDEATMHVDLWVGPSPATAIELKYATRALAVTVEDEEYALKNHGAQALVRYDFVEDIARLERVISAGRCRTGAAVLITNDVNYWDIPTKRDCIDAEFRVHEGRVLGGTLAWTPRASAGTTKGREETITLSGRYTLRWADYSVLPAPRNGRFRYLLVVVG